MGLVGGLTTGFATVVRVGPALIGLLYVVRRRWLAAIVAVGTVCVIGALSVLVAGANAWMTYMRTSLGGAIQPTALSVPGLLVAQGVDTGVAHYAIVGVWIVAGIAIVVLRARPRIAFVVAVVASIYATPVVRMEFWALLLAGAAPWVLHGPSDAEGLVADAAIGGS